MKKFCTTLSLALFYCISFSQVSIDWMKTIKEPSESAGSIAIDSINNTYAAAVHGNTTYITKRNKGGKTLWRVQASSSYLEGIVKMFVDPQGNPVVTGFQYYNTINGIVAVGIIVRKFTAAGDSVYRTIVPGLFTWLDGGDIEHPGTNRTKITAVMDALGNIYFGTAGDAVSGKGFIAIKISRGGALIHIISQNFNQDTTGNPLYFANNITLQKNRLALTGMTRYPFANVSTWVLDTAGSTLWTDVSEGILGNDVAFDDAANAYVLASVKNAVNQGFTADDVAIYVFNKNGRKLGMKAYDFGGDELPSEIEYSPDKNFVIIGTGTGTSTLGFGDWLVMKIDAKGKLLWHRTYNRSNYDERPRTFVLDSSGNVYVTGSGGPDTGDFLYGLYGVTIKYRANGTEQWTSLIHLYNFTPVDLVLGKDTSLFILSAPAATVAHLIQKSKSDSCAVPSALQSSAITNNSAMLRWKNVPDVFLYYLQYKTSTGNQWTQVSLDSNQYLLTGLQQGTQYEFRVQAICAVGPSEFSAGASFTTTGAGYCASKGPNNNYQWIDGVHLGAINTYPSGPNDGYADFTNLSARLVPGSTYTITTNKYNLSGGWESWRIWIDYNHDGDFEDANELIVEYSNNYNYDYHDFTVPVNVMAGTTRMRVSMKAGTIYSAPCETFAEGEVEDYTVNIISNEAFAFAENKTNFSTGKVSLLVSPNPSANIVTVSCNGFKAETRLQLFDAAGKMVLSENVNSVSVKLNIAALQKGVYLLKASDGLGNTKSIKIMKQ
jgi:hypothetical protein